VYPRLAFLRDGHENLLFPFHPVMVTVLLRELLIVDGTLDRSTLAINREKQSWYLHVETGDIKVMPQVEGHLLQQWKAYESATSGENGRRRRRRRMEEASTIHKRPCRLEGHSTPISDTSPIRTVLSEQDTSPPSRVECPSGEDLVAAMLARRGIKDVQDEKSHTIKENCINSFTGLEKLTQQAPRARKVSDLDMVDGRNMGNSKTNLISSMEAMITVNDIGRFAKVIPSSGRFQLFTRDLPHLLEAGISTEESLRSLALIHCEDLMRSFSDDCLRKVLGYKSSMVDRKNRLLAKLVDYLFATSHALFVWEQTQKDLQYANDRRTQAQRESYMRKILFDSRTLENLGGWKWSCLFRQAVHLLAANVPHWEAWARTKAGRKALEHHMSNEACLRVASRRRQKSRRSDLMHTSCSNVKRGRHQFVEMVASNDALGPLPKSSNGPSSSVISPSIRTVQLERKEGQSWGVLLSHEDGMCVVARGTDSLYNGLRTGDVILCVDNEEGSKAQIFYHKIVDIFKTSRRLTLKIQRRQE